MASSFRADIDTDSYMQAMRILDREAMPRMVADTLNAAAEATAKEARRNVNRQMIVRTRFTINSIRQDRHARGPNIRRMYSRAGSVSPYLAIHDEGGTIRAKADRVPIPTLQARTGRSLRRKIAGRYSMRRMGQFGGGSKFFITRSRTGKLGIYERMARRIRMVRNLEERQVTIPRNRWFSSAVGRYGTRQFMQAQFNRAARQHLRRLRGE